MDKYIYSLSLLVPLSEAVSSPKKVTILEETQVDPHLDQKSHSYDAMLNVLNIKKI